MSTVVTGVGLTIAAGGVVAVIAPDWLRSLFDWRTRAAKWSSGAIRVVLGAIFWLAAPETRAPFAFQVFGGVVGAAGLALFFLPLSAWQSLVDWGIGLPAPTYRVFGVATTLFGLLLAYAA